MSTAPDHRLPHPDQALALLGGLSPARFMQRHPDFRVTPYAEGMAAMVASLR